MMKTALITLGAAAFALTSFGAMAQSNVEVMEGLTAEQLKEITDKVKEDPEAFEQTISTGQCVSANLTPKELNALKTFGVTINKNVKSHCTNGRPEKAQAYVKSKLGEFTRTSTFKTMSGCIQTKGDADNITTVLMGYMGMPAGKTDEASICDVYGYADKSTKLSR